VSFDTALRATEVLLGLAFLHSCAEHMVSTPRDRLLFGARAILSAPLLAGTGVPWVLAALSLHSIALLRRFKVTARLAPPA